MKLKQLLAAALLTVSAGASAQSVGDIISYNDAEYEVKGANLITNGSFDDGVNGWYSGNWGAANASKYTLQTEGGFDNGAYLQYSAGGAGADTNIRGKWAVENGKMYLFRCYTSGSTPASNNLQYSKLHASADGSAETTALYQLQWPAAAGKTSTDWKQNDFVFTASTSWVVFRSSWTSNAKLDGFVLCEVERYISPEGYNKALQAAKDARDSEDYASITGKERTALENAITTYTDATSDKYEEAINALEKAVATFTAAKVSYDVLVAEIAYAKTISVSTTDAEAALNTDATAASIVEATQALKVLEYNTVKGAYTHDVTSFLGAWSQGSYGTTKGQGYTGDESYFDKWNGSATDLTSSATVTLPAGKYAVMVAGRGVSTTTMSLSVKVGEAEAVSTPFLMNGDTGKGIDTAGATNFSEEGTYSNNNAGRGWQYRYITFETTGEEVTIAINGHLNAGTWQSFYAPVLLCDDATYAPIAVDAAKAELQVAINAAPAVRTANIGDGAFQFAAAGVNTYSDALTAAQDAHDATSATLTSIEQAKNDLASAIVAYNALEVNAPADGQLFTVSLASGEWAAKGINFSNEAMTFIANDRADAGLYNIQYKAAANQNLAQAFTFTKVDGNNYKMSQIDADGNARYICTGVPYSGNTAQIRTTTNADDALVVTVIPTATEGKWNLRNTEANQYIGAQDAGVYTVNSHIDFALVETTKPSIAINTTAAGWGTVMLPFAVASLPAEVKAYSCAEVDGNTLTLVEATELVANKPYIIEGAWNETLTGDAQGIDVTYTEGLLTGTYAQVAAPNGSYILQKQDEKVGFYLVDTEVAQPNVPANHAYLTNGGGSAVKAFFLGGGEDAIQSVFDGVAAGEIYNVAGQRINKLQRGVNIVNGKKVVIK